MRYNALILVFIFLVCSSSLSVAQTKHALIFAIGNYPQKGGWPTISSLSDVSYIKSALLNQGFQENNIKVVSDEEATPAGIKNAFDELNKKVRDGDIVVIHFSSHGEQVEDDNGDETDGLDETIVTYNAVAPDLLGHFKDFKKDQAEYLRDDQVGVMIDELRSKLGKNGDVLVLMDLCHSGSGSRGVAKVRGDKPPLVSSTFDFKKYPRGDTAGVFKERRVSRGDESSLATYIVISAARAEEVDHETKDENNKGVGSLTYAISKVFEKLEPGTSYRSLFSRVQSVMNDKVPGQHPVLEGNGIDRAFFGGKFLKQKPYVEIEKINDREVMVRGGLFAGLDIGAKVAVYNAGTVDPGKAIALDSGKVVRADMYRATIRLNGPSKINEAVAGWVFVTAPSYNTKPINIGIEPGKIRGVAGFSEIEIKSMKEEVKDLQLIQFNGEPDLVLIKGVVNDSIKVASNGYLFTTFRDLNSNPGQLKDALQKYAQYKFLAGLEVKDPVVNVEVKLIPLINGKPDTAKINSKVSNGIYEFCDGDSMMLSVKNTGRIPVYFNVLDMQPDGVINPVVPNSEMRVYARDLRVEAGTERIFERSITVRPPYGMEIFKVFVSPDAIDLEAIAASRGAAVRGNLTVLENLVKNSYNIAKRGVDVGNTSGANGSSYNVLFRIKPKE